MNKKQDPFICCLQDTHFRWKDTQTESEGMEKDILYRNEKKVGVAILTSDKSVFKTKNVKRYK